MGLAELKAAGRLEILHRDVPVELSLDGDDVVARSLICTHQGCRIEWVDEGYSCPCHEGRFNARGENVAGPPRMPLRLLPVRVEGESVVVSG